MKYFTIEELTKSETANKLKIDNTPNEKVKENLTALVDNVLDPLRELYGKPIYVNSGYRCEKLNKIVGGVANSQHATGEAADIEGYNRSVNENKKLFNLILTSDLPFDQLINENNFAWVHVSYKKNGKNRRQVLKL